MKVGLPSLADGSSLEFLTAEFGSSVRLSTPETSDLRSVMEVGVTVKLVLLCDWEETGVNAEFVVSCVKDGGSVLAGDANAEGVKSLGEGSANVDKVY